MPPCSALDQVWNTSCSSEILYPVWERLLQILQRGSEMVVDTALAPEGLRLVQPGKDEASGEPSSVNEEVIKKRAFWGLLQSEFSHNLMKLMGSCNSETWGSLVSSYLAIGLLLFLSLLYLLLHCRHWTRKFTFFVLPLAFFRLNLNIVLQ